MLGAIIGSSGAADRYASALAVSAVLLAGAATVFGFVGRDAKPTT